MSPKCCEAAENSEGVGIGPMLKYRARVMEGEFDGHLAAVFVWRHRRSH